MQGERPFDAHEIYLSDQARETAGRRTISPVVTLRGMLEGGRAFKDERSAARVEAFSTAASELTRRGLDTTALVRHGMFQQVLGALIANLTAARLAPHWHVEPFAGFENFDHEAWAKVLHLPAKIPVIDAGSPRAASKAFANLIIPTIPRIMSWISVASLQDMVCLTPPGSIRGLPQEDLSQFLALQVPYRWMVDYFSHTFLHEWETESLHLTHRWMKGLEVPPCSPELMEDRKIDPELLAFEIADRVTADEGRKSPVSTSTSMTVRPLTALSTPPEETTALVMVSLAMEMTRHAKHLLSEGRLREAAAVFEFGVQGAPESADLHNNWGFCLIPLEPSKALNLLIRAEELGFYNEALTIYNQMCCLFSLGRHKAALSLAAGKWEQIRSAPSLHATIWKLEGSGWVLKETENLGQDLVELAISVATSNGWHGELEIWSVRRRDLSAS
ncbi:hypothetical protein AB0B89_09375 [Sphaerisporangium sp. NPDC049002]|uniref:tetratricopeptide repeat protein n=1 Tax=unclassified Sphaerisporangium TaxID=2630420 RepID=UPI0033ED2BD7